ncbi:MAG: cation transporter [Geopsychrobacter sp.]|nr:cation transporter [Geopsychrobacter sp.]
MNKIVKRILMLLVLAGGALTLASLAENCADLKFCGTSSAQAAAEQNVELSVDGMTCASCKYTVKTVLKQLDGVQNVSVSYAEKRATVSYDPQRITPEQLVQAINETGRYQATLPPQ